MPEPTVLVTGAGGFIGSHLVEELLASGHQVRAFVRYASHGRTGWLADIPSELRSKLTIHYGDIIDSRSVREAVRGCETVYHLAALIGIPYSYVAPESYVNVNINGTLNVLEAARAEKSSRILVTSTSEVYGTALYTPIDEEHPYQAQSPYSATKIGADQIALSYYRSFNLPVTIVRPFNTFGPRQSARAVIPTIITQALYSKQITIGSRTPVRDMVYVKDTARGFLAIAQSDACVGQVTNLATGVGVTVGELADRIQNAVGKNLPVIESADRIRPEKSEVFTLLGANGQARERAHWSPTVDLQQGLDATIDWFRLHTDVTTVGHYQV
ncbi:MAG: SDR family NAD(P)-dependent oxidoreductase [Pirellula sp.]